MLSLFASGDTLVDVFVHCLRAQCEKVSFSDLMTQKRCGTSTNMMSENDRKFEAKIRCAGINDGAISRRCASISRVHSKNPPPLPRENFGGGGGGGGRWVNFEGFRGGRRRRENFFSKNVV